MRLIDADDLMARLRKDPLFGLIEPYGIERVIAAALTIEAEPVRRGRWDKGVNDKWVCSECGVGNMYAYSWDIKGYKLQDRYCPHCGAKMEG